MTALVAVEGSLTGFPTWIPYSTAVVDVEVTTTGIHRYAVVAIACDATELGIFIEVVATGSIADEPEEVFIA